MCSESGITAIFARCYRKIRKGEPYCMKNFYYHVPTDIYFGKGQLSALGERLPAMGKRVLLVYGGGSIKRVI